MTHANLSNEYAQLAARIKAGDEGAFEEMYRKSERLVYATCYGILRNNEDARDAAQETYITLYNKIDTLSDDHLLLGWIKTIAANKALDMYRRKKGDISYDDAVESDEILRGNDDLECLPDTYIYVDEKREILRRIMHEQLSDVQYQTVILYYYDELPITKIAELMNCPEGTVKTRLKAARILIRSGIEKYEKDNDDKFAAAVALPFMSRFLSAEAESFSLPVLDLPAIMRAKDSAWTAGSTQQPASQPATAMQPAVSRSAAPQPYTQPGLLASAAPQPYTQPGLLASTAGKALVAILSIAAVVGVTIGIIAIANSGREDDGKMPFGVESDGSMMVSETAAFIDDQLVTIDTLPTPAPTDYSPMPGGPSVPASSAAESLGTSPSTATSTAPSTAPSTAAVSDPYSAPDTGWKTAYVDLAGTVSIDDFYYTSPATGAVYEPLPDESYEICCALLFINDDDVPELLVRLKGTIYQEDFYRLYTYSNGTAVLLDEFYNDCYIYDTMLYAPRANRLLINGAYGSEGEANYTIASMAPDNATLDYTPSGFNTYSDWSDVGYTVNEAAYNEYYGFDTYSFIELEAADTVSSFLEKLLE